MGWVRSVQQAWDWIADRFFYVVAAVCIFGFAATVLSIPLQFGFVHFTGELSYQGEVLKVDGFPSTAPLKPGQAPHPTAKEVGYVSALNWSLYGAIVLPIILVFCLRVRGAMRSTLTELAANGMLRREDFQRVTPEEALGRWQRYQTGEIVLVSLVGALVIAFALYDWWQVVGAPLLELSRIEKPALADPVMEYDWSVSSLFRGANVATWPLLVFGLIVYVVIPGLGSAIAFATFIGALHFLALTSGLITPREGPRWRLAVKPTPNDKLLGFSTFAPLFSNLVSAAVAIIFGLLIMMVQNNYLRSPGHGDIFSFVIGEGKELDTIRQANVGEVVPKFLAWFMEPSVIVGRNPQVGIGLLVFAFVFAMSLAACWAILRASARTAGAWSLGHAAALAKETGQSRPKVEKEIREMKYWPIGWISLNQLLLLMVFLLAAVFSYRLALLAGVWILLKALRAIPSMVSSLLPKAPV